MENSRTILELEGVGKEFYGNRVLEGISFELKAGRILGLVGENGAGKTTLMKILFGMSVIRETGGFEGKIRLDGSPVDFKSPFDALDAGIGMVHQEFSLLPGFTAEENILLNRESLKSNFLVEVFGPRMSVLDRAAMRVRSGKAIARLGVKLDPGMLVSEMPVGHKQFTEIARELDRESLKLLVLDEPTAVLAESEARVLLDGLRRLADEGIAIIFISHRLHEIVEICDEIVVLRDGRLVKKTPAAGLGVREIASWMVGREMADRNAPPDRGAPPAGAAAKEAQSRKDIALSLRGLWVDMPGETVRGVDLDVMEGEILGIGGLAGQGKLGIPNGVMGLFPSGGEVRLRGETIRLGHPRQALEAGMAFVSEDRRGVGLLLDEALDWNIAFPAMQIKGEYLIRLLGGLVKWRDDAAIAALAREYIGKLDIKCRGHRQKARELSGGNQQKICLAKAFALRPNLLFVSEPTRGIDVGAKALVLDAIRERNRADGTTVVIVSSELEELRSVCDRVAIVSEGRIAGILPPGADAGEFGFLMSGEGGAA